MTSPVHRTSVTDDPALAREWFGTFEGAGLDGIVAKPVDGPYEPDKRTMFKVKHERTADCVVAGFRWHKTSTPDKPLLGSFLLGLYAEDGRLQHVGVVASFPIARRAELIEELAPWRENALADHPWRDWAEAQAQFEGRMPGAQSRWNAKKDLSWEPLRPERVVEVRYDHMEGTRFRHTTQFVRWRDDRDPTSCTYEQLEVPVSYDLSSLLSSGLGWPGAPDLAWPAADARGRPRAGRLLLGRRQRAVRGRRGPDQARRAGADHQGAGPADDLAGVVRRLHLGDPRRRCATPPAATGRSRSAAGSCGCRWTTATRPARRSTCS